MKPRKAFRPHARAPSGGNGNSNNSSGGGGGRGDSHGSKASEKDSGMSAIRAAEDSLSSWRALKASSAELCEAEMERERLEAMVNVSPI